VTLRGVLSAALATTSFARLSGHSGEVFAPDAAVPLALAALTSFRAANRAAAVWAIVPNESDVERMRSAVQQYCPDCEVLTIPSWETLPHERLSPSPEVVGRRIESLWRIQRLQDARSDASNRGTLVLLSLRSALQKLIATAAQLAPLRLEASKDYLLPELTLKLIEFAYERTDLVTRRGEFAIRGGILDVFPTTAEHAVRLEFFGDELEELREFSVSDQRSIGTQLSELTIFPARELQITPQIARRAREMAPEFPNLEEMLVKISEGIPVAGMEALAAVLGDGLQPITRLALGASRIVLVNPTLLESQAKSLVDTNAEFLHAAWDAAIAGGNAPLDLSAGGYLDWAELQGELTSLGVGILELSPLLSGDSQAVQLDWREVPTFTSIAQACDWISEQTATGRAVVIAASASGTADRIVELLEAAEISVTRADEVAHPGPGVVAVTIAQIPTGLVIRDAGFVLISDSQFLVRAAETTGQVGRKLAAKRGVRVDPLSLARGDFVVHDIHGIGKFVELVQREIGVGAAKQTREYLVIEFAPPKRGYPADTLFVPTDSLDLLTRYIGSDEPTLSRMGGTEWAKAKNSARKAVRKLAVDLVKLYSQRVNAQGYAFAPDTAWQRELESAFPFRETPDQLVTIDEVKRDMERPIPMDRLLAGDVGFGKTEVAVRAAFKAVQDGKQVAVLVPTTLLVRQHVETFRSRFSGFPVSVKPLSRFQSAAEVAETLHGIQTGAIDIVIGTHRLLGEKVRFKDLGLLIIDEEQRFGVEHKEKMKALRANVDVLAMSATPIPRTLEMAVTGIREMSTLATPPEERQPVLTYVGGYSESQVAAAIKRELIREGQVFFVHNRVENIDLVAKRLQEIVPQARIAVAHGKLPESELERVVVDFWERKFDVLVATTIVEAGLDIPNANTLIVDRAERFGLSQLHQIRGRVGRGKERAYAYFFYDPAVPISTAAFDRLATIATNSELGGGMQIALKDLEMRGAGNMLGGEQSGHIAGVGFDLYLRMIGDAVAEFRGQPVARANDLKLELPIDARIPESYIDAERLRLEAYQKIAAAASRLAKPEDLSEVTQELQDRYGEPPEAVQNLLRAAELRRVSALLDLVEVNLLGGSARLAPVKLSDRQLVALAARVSGVKYLQSSNLLTVRLPIWQQDSPKHADQILNFTAGLLAEIGTFQSESVAPSDPTAVPSQG